MGAGGAENTTDTASATPSLRIAVARSRANRENHLGDPILKALGFRLVGAHDQLVKAGFADDDPIATTQFISVFQKHSVPLTVIEVSGRVGSDLDVQSLADIVSYEPRVTFDLHKAHFKSIEVEQLDGGGVLMTWGWR